MIVGVRWDGSSIELLIRNFPCTSHWSGSFVDENVTKKLEDNGQTLKLTGRRLNDALQQWHEILNEQKA